MGQARKSAGDMRGSLLELAKKLFAERGYVAASLRDLAEFAGVTAAAVYYHFSKKEDLLREMIFDGLERLSEQVVSALAGAGSPAERLEAVVRAHLRYNVDFPRESRIIIEESRFLNEVDYAAAREKQMAILNAYRACVRQLLASGRVTNVEPAWWPSASSPSSAAGIAGIGRTALSRRSRHSNTWSVSRWPARCMGQKPPPREEGSAQDLRDPERICVRAARRARGVLSGARGAGTTGGAAPSSARATMKR